MKSRASILVAISLALFACGDEAAPKLKECRDAQARRDLEAATAACEEAVKAHPDSVSGREAQARLDDLKAEAHAKAKAKALEAEQRKPTRDGGGPAKGGTP